MGHWQLGHIPHLHLFLLFGRISRGREGDGSYGKSAMHEIIRSDNRTEHTVLTVNAPGIEITTTFFPFHSSVLIFIAERDECLLMRNDSARNKGVSGRTEAASQSIFKLFSPWDVLKFSLRNGVAYLNHGCHSTNGISIGEGRAFSPY